MAGRGQILERKYGFLVRIFAGSDPQTGKRKYINEKVRGNKKDANKVLTALLRKLDMGELVLEPTRMNIKEYLEYWLETAAKPRLYEYTHKEYGKLMERYIYPQLADKRLTKLTPMDIQRVYGEMLNRGLSARVVRYTHTVFSNALTQSVKWRMLTQNPAQYVDLPKQRKTEMKCLSEKEVQLFLEHAKLDPHYVLFTAMITTGVRIGEVLALKWTDFDAMKNIITVQRSWGRLKKGHGFKPPKTQRGFRNITIPTSFTKMLLEHKELQPWESELIFPSQNNTPLNERNVITRHFKPILKKAGLPDIRLYDLRHTQATLLLQAGEHPKIVSERLGHSSIQLTLDTYSHVLPNMQQGSAEKLENIIFERVGTQTAHESKKVELN